MYVSSSDRPTLLASVINGGPDTFIWTIALSIAANTIVYKQ